MQSLVFFNKEGDNLNFKYDSSTEMWTGDLIFDSNGNDTFKTIGLYTFEKIPSFEYENVGNLKADKFQLFNEYRFNITGSKYLTQSVTMIEIVNTNPQFYSKWIYGDQFEIKYPVGSQIIFNSPIFEFTNPNQSFTVVQNEEGAIMIISNLDNQNFEALYGTQLGLTSSYQNLTISGLNSFGVYNYVDSSLNNTLSSWSEPDFYSKWFNNRKFTLLNTSKNDGVYTVSNKDIFDKVYYRFTLDKLTFTQSNDVLMELVLKTDLPVVYSGPINLNANTISFSGNTVPQILKPGVEFVINGSILNSNNLVVDSIPQYSLNNSQIFYDINSEVIWNNQVYQCIQAYYLECYFLR
jgi:hypothetical protein